MSKILPRHLQFNLHEAQRLACCRLCRRSERTGGAFVYNHGKEYAHEECLKQDSSGSPPQKKR